MNETRVRQARSGAMAMVVATSLAGAAEPPADFVLLSENRFQLPPERLESARVDLTVIGGRVVFERAAR